MPFFVKFCLLSTSFTVLFPEPKIYCLNMRPVSFVSLGYFLREQVAVPDPSLDTIFLFCLFIDMAFEMIEISKNFTTMTYDFTRNSKD